MSDVDGLTITHTVVGRAGKAALTVKLSDDIKKVTRINVLEEGERAAFETELQEMLPLLAEPEAAAELDAALLAIAEDVSQQLAGSSARSREATDSQGQPDPRGLLAETPEDIKEEAQALLADPGLVQRILEDVAALGIAGECELAAALYLVGTSRLLLNPLATIAQGPSSSGKSYVIRLIGRLFPPEAVIHATQMTPQALFHMVPGSLVHRFIIAGERSRLRNDDSAEATRALREMLSEGRLSKLMPVKVAGEIQTALIEQEGPIAYVESTTLTRIDEEDLNRCILLNTDEQPDQTRRILRRLADRVDPSGWTADAERIVLKHHAAQRMLSAEPVVIPYAGRIADLFPAERVEARRVFGHLLNMIEALVILHQYQRPRDDSGRLLATADDYRLAKHLMAVPVARQLGAAASGGARRALDRMRVADLGDRFTAQEAGKVLAMTDRCTRAYLGELLRTGDVELVEPGRGPVPHKWRLATATPRDDTWSGLPAVEEIMSEGDFRLSDKAQVLAPAALRSECGSSPGTSGKGA